MVLGGLNQRRAQHAVVTGLPALRADRSTAAWSYQVFLCFANEHFEYSGGSEGPMATSGDEMYVEPCLSYMRVVAMGSIP